MKRFALILLVAPLALAACANPGTRALETAAAIPAYNVGAQALIDQNTKKPFTPAQVEAIKTADQKLYDGAVILNAEQVEKARVLHERIQNGFAPPS